jgi:hypothetical protein
MALVLAGCPKHGSADHAALDQYVGVWESFGGGRITLEIVSGDVAVASIIDSDSEVFEVLSNAWVDGLFTYEYRVPSTGYEVREQVMYFDGEGLHVSWSNSAGTSGTEVFVKVE